MNEEIWKDIDGYQGKYKISNHGNVARKLTGKLLRPNSDSHGYLRARLFDNGIPKTILIHRLVAEYFICKRPDGKEINHKDSNRSNNHVNNLEWVTRSENTIHAFRFGNKHSQLLGMCGEKKLQGKTYKLTSNRNKKSIRVWRFLSKRFSNSFWC